MSYQQTILDEFSEKICTNDNLTSSVYTVIHRHERSTFDVDIYSIFETAKLTTEIHWGYDARCIAHIDIIHGKDTTYLEVSSLRKGDTISGKDVLIRLENIARKLEIHCIRLTDNSHFTYTYKNKNYNVALDALSVLCDGQTWYNKKGYVSEKQDIIDAHNFLAISKPLESLQILQPLHSYFEEKKTQPIYKVFSEIRKKMHDNDVKDIPMFVIIDCLQHIQDSEALEVEAKHSPIWLTGEFIYLYKNL